MLQISAKHLMPLFLLFMFVGRQKSEILPRGGGIDSKGLMYGFYTDGRIKSGLTHSSSEFFLNGKPFRIFSGSLHYFRFPPQSWKESIRKMKDCHLNTVSTYIPWHLHEEKPGVYNFRDNLDLKAFIELVKSEDMFLMLRVGPYICAEVDFGGLPSWLLKDKTLKVRTNYLPYLNAVRNYFSKIINLVKKYQFTVSGGPIIAVQVENEFGSVGNTQNNSDDFEYMVYLKRLLVELGIRELLFTSDMPSIGYLKGSIPGVLMTANFQNNATKELEILKRIQPDKPLMVAELWSGWFDHWGKKHEERSVDILLESLKVILSSNASFNLYMFQGGTNFGFSSGANVNSKYPDSPYSYTVTSYDYDSLLSESGDYKEKYFATQSLLKSVIKEVQRPQTILDIKSSYMDLRPVPVRKFLPLNKILTLVRSVQNPDPLLMEDLNQAFGFTLYETYFAESGTLTFVVTKGIRYIIFINSVVYDLKNTHGLQLLHITHTLGHEKSKLWIFAENLGRINFAAKREILNDQQRGIVGEVRLNGSPLKGWTMYVLDFSKQLIRNIALMKLDEEKELVLWQSPLTTGFYFSFLDLVDVKDTFIYSPDWHKGVVFVNGFNIGRYWKIGPQQTLFLSKHFLKEGSNEIIAFELQNTIKNFELRDKPI